MTPAKKAATRSAEPEQQANMPYVITGHPLNPPTAIPIPESVRDLIQVTGVGQTMYCTLNPIQASALRGQGIIQ